MSSHRSRRLLGAASATLMLLGGVGVLLLGEHPAHPTTSGPSLASPLGGNGHNVTFDGRVFVVRRGPDAADGGWFATVLRPQRIGRDAQGAPDLSSGAFSDFALIQPVEQGENALALCQPDPARVPYACGEDGEAAAEGPYACYDLVVIDSNAYANQYNGLRARDLRLQIEAPGTADASVRRWWWRSERRPLMAGGRALRGIEPTVTEDGRLLVWQGHPDNDGKIDVLMYASAAEACSVTGWDGPHNLSHMVNDPPVRSRYRLAERQLRAADGTPYPDGALVRGAYPWLFHEGDALIFASTVVPCRASEDPPGCGARRGAMAVMGYPTNWGLSHIDGPINPDTDQTVRLFFSSPGPHAFEELPVTPGLDVWPFFGSNTSNYAEVVFDDGLDGTYAGVWHLNESVNLQGELDRGRTPDTSGYFNTGLVRGATFPLRNNTPTGKGLIFDGQRSWVEVPHSSSLNPVNAITVELRLRVDAPVDCDGGNNYRFLLGKGNIGDGAYSLVLEDDLSLQARVKVGGEQRALHSGAGRLSLGQWHDVAMVYDGTTGLQSFYIDGVLASEVQHAPGTLDGSGHALTFGAPGAARAACPQGDGAFNGVIDEVRISRAVRDVTGALRPGQHAAFVRQRVPAEVVPGAAFEAELTLRNVGTTRWSPEGAYRLGSQAPQDNGRWGAGRVELPRAVDPGEEVTFVMSLTAPMERGDHDMQWRMVQDGVAWFGAFTPLTTVRVTDAPALEPDAGMPEQDVSEGEDVAQGGEDAAQGGEDASEVEDAAPDEPDVVIAEDVSVGEDVRAAEDASPEGEDVSVSEDASATPDAPQADAATPLPPLVTQPAEGCAAAPGQPSTGLGALLLALGLLLWRRA